ncbi:MAG: valine--tRNA ligase [Candidatus Saccharibacteria bacterium]|nr:valine--tRNA ligase [Candidatus Saccharibacteria bacterium]
MKLPKVYEPHLYESDIYALWEKTESFKPKHRGSKDNYSIVVPPPNANGDLHLGHGLTLALEDIAIRYHRLKGDATLFVPGADHAGFETQVVYEKQLAAEGKSRFDFTREELYDRIWDFVAQNKQNYLSQFRKLGASASWDHYTFTLDEKIVKQAYGNFKKMWDEGLVYRGERLVNYCTHHRTGFADVEVVYEDETTPLYYMQYGPFELATTRPETKFGDTAVAVHPEDDRYKQYVGQVITVEGVNGPFEIQVLADEMVDREFGTGVVKITPAHDPNDWEVAQRHNLPAVRVINHDGTMNEHAGRFRGMTVMDARQAVVDALKEKNLLIKVDKDYTNRVGKCYKCGTVIEPMLMKQWFINMQPLAKPAIKALKQKKIMFYPDSKRKQLISYLEGLHDWNISRQIAWGIPIPAFQNVDDEDDWIYDEHVTEEIITVDNKTYHRDPDVFDTWFSSSSWPYATLGGSGTKDYEQFYPLSLMETGADILYPWVSRMIMFGLYNTGKVPFESVYLHGLVLDPHGAKMSKSKGNVVDPMEKIDTFGSDAFRMGIVAGQTPGNNQPYDESKLIGARNFCNKLWNIARYVEGKLGDEFKPGNSPHPKSVADYWVINRINYISKQVSSLLDEYRFSEAYETLYHFVWDDFADWYIEASKVHLNKDTIAYGLESILKLAHPFAPFVTETVWQTLGWRGDKPLAISDWPKTSDSNTTKADTFEEIKLIVNEVRFIKNELGDADLQLFYTDEKFLDENGILIQKLAKLKGVQNVKDGYGLHLTQTRYQCWLNVDEQAAQRFITSLANKKAQQEKNVDQLEKRLANKAYVKQAPKELVAQSKQQLKEARELLEKVTEEYKRFNKPSA